MFYPAPSRNKKTLTRHFLHQLTRFGLERPGALLLIACSGGADSVSLLRLSAEAAQRKGFDLVVGHVHHGLRGRESDRDAAFVEDLCRRLSLRCHVSRVDVKAFAAFHHLGLEAAGRVCRYRALTNLARRAGAQAILTAHTLEDQAETVLLNLLRGSGTLGLCGIWEKTVFPGGRIPVIRPLLNVSRYTLRDYLRLLPQRYREDSSNCSTAFLRNWVRRHALPFLKRRSPSLDRHLARLSAILREEEFFWGEFKSHIDLKQFLRYPIALQRRLLHDALPVGARFDVIESLRTTPARFQSSPPAFSGRQSKAFSRALKVPGSNSSLPRGWRLTARLDQGRPDNLDKGPWTALLDWEKVSNERFAWRSCKPGDRFQPLGMAGTKKVADFLCDEKIPDSVKGEIPVVDVGGRPVWLVGLRLAESVRVGPETRRTLILNASKKP